MINKLFITMLNENNCSPGEKNLLNQLQRQIFFKRRWCSLYGGIGRELYFSSCYRTTEPLIRTCTFVSWMNWMLPSSESDQSWWIGKVLYSTTVMRDHTQVWSHVRNFCSFDGMSYLPHNIPLILHYRITICSGLVKIRWMV